MNRIAAYFRELAQATAAGWNRFWFTPADPATLALIRILAGSMLFYTHLVWSLDLQAFFDLDGWLGRETIGPDAGRDPAWSLFWLCRSPLSLWSVHLAALTAFLMLTVGFHSRIAAILSWFFAVSYANRVPFALFGLDQINAFLAMYLMLGPCGALYSVDRLRSRRGESQPAGARNSIGANIAVRLMQLHLCILYLFAGLSKLQGPAWWDGTALWNAVANLEYQSIDVTWLARWPILVNAATHVTILWEVSYCALVWPRLTRPLMLCLAVPLHLGIAFCLGMTAFGLAMLIANAAFVSPTLVREIAAAIFERRGRKASQVSAHRRAA